MAKGKLYLIPSTLGNSDIQVSLPQGVISIIHTIDEFIVENEKSARKFLKETGITIHYVNEKYDEGAIIAQYKVALNSNDTPQQIAGKIAELEAKYFPSCVEEVIRDLGRC